MRIRVVALLVIAAIAGFGCSRRHCVPDSITANRNLIDLSADPDSHAPVGAGMVREVEAEFRKRSAAKSPPGARPYHFLALSGGGMYGAFGVGVLNGWSEAGTRPAFDVVTGISTGALIATYAFLGPQHDEQLKSNMLGVTRADILRSRTILAIPFADAVYNSNPLARTIEKQVTPELLAEVAGAHAAGRRLYIGTTNIDTRRLVIWDMGAIASRGTCESAELYRKIILASSSIPGVFPPVKIPVEVNGHSYDELHVDGGVSDEVIFRAFMVADLNRLAGIPGDTAPTGSTLYVVDNGKLYADPKCVRPRLTNMFSASFRSIVYGKTRDELYRIYLNCMETGVGFRLTALPQEFQLESTGGLSISKDDQQRLFAEGYQLGAVPKEQWRQLPPGTDRTEQALPRTGTRFATP